MGRSEDNRPAPSMQAHPEWLGGRYLHGDAGRFVGGVRLGNAGPTLVPAPIGVDPENARPSRIPHGLPAVSAGRAIVEAVSYPADAE
jgi:hypothetical protein